MGSKQNDFAILFDMDGVIVDNISYHVQAWKEFCKKYGNCLTDDEFNKNFSGRTNKEIFRNLFKRELSLEEVKKYEDEKESMYRDLYKMYIEPRKGLIKLLELLKKNGIKAAVGTAAPKVNLDFVLEYLKIEKYFDAFISSESVTKGKPDPEIYLKAAELLNANPKRCIVIEDSLLGIQAGLNAGAKVIGMTTVHKREELTNTDFVIDDFENLSIYDLKEIVGL